MSIRQTLASRLAPIPLRLALAGVFLWAGYGKILVDHEYGPEELAVLASMGVAKARAAASGAGASIDAPQDPVAEPASPDGPQSPLPDPARKGGKRSTHAAIAHGAQAEPTVAPLAATTEGEPAGAAAGLPAHEVYDASRFEKPARLATYYRLALMLRSAGQAPADGAGRRLWPASWASGDRPVWFARAAAYTELLGGGLMLLGFFARFSALALAGVMVVAMWFTSIGPNLGAPGSFLGFLPGVVSSSTPPEAAQALVGAWQTMLLQATTLACAVGVVLAGAGALSLDAFVFSGKGGQPKAPRPEA